MRYATTVSRRFPLLRKRRTGQRDQAHVHRNKKNGRQIGMYMILYVYIGVYNLSGPIYVHNKQYTDRLFFTVE